MSSGKLMIPENPATTGRGRCLTATDYQLVSLYTDLRRSDIDYFQSIAGIYDVTQMRGLLQCRLDQMERRRRYLARERNSGIDVYRVYLERKYSDRRPHPVPPTIRPQHRQQKPISRIANYPVIRGQQLPESKKNRVHFVSDRSKTDCKRQTSKGSTASARDDEPAVLERTDAARRRMGISSESQAFPGKAKKPVRTEKSSEKLQESNKQPCARASGRPKGMLRRQTKEDPVSIKTNAEVRKILKVTTVCRKKELEAAKKRCSDKGKKASEKEGSARSSAYENEVPIASAMEDVPDSYSSRELDAAADKAMEDDRDKCQGRVSEAEEFSIYSPDIAKSESLGEELHAVFSRETNPDYLTPFESSDVSADDNNNDYDDNDYDLIAEYARQDDPVERHDKDDINRAADGKNKLDDRNSASECGSGRLDEDAAADYAAGNAPVGADVPISSCLSLNMQDDFDFDDPASYAIDVNKKDSFFDLYDAKGRPVKSNEAVLH